jgi:hypothetical protein
LEFCLNNQTEIFGEEAGFKRVELALRFVVEDIALVSFLQLLLDPKVYARSIISVELFN